MALTLKEAAALLRRFDRESKATVLKVIDAGTAMALRLSVTKYMEGLGSGENAEPPNPPPGPLGIRSGKLRRTVKRIPARYVKGVGYTGGLQAGGAGVRYAGVHEGLNADGTERPFTRMPEVRPRRAKFLVFRGRDGKLVFAKKVRARIIYPRPYMKPALTEARDWILYQAEQELGALALRLVG